ncbi:MAG TPA: Uma2 family endonuclease, partial [Planctomycetaceae bacterium]|nr:Uma2 family endonuclease [Planctomycetaceae bacterium]
LTKAVTPARTPSVSVRSESPPKKPNYESGYLPQPIEYPDSDGQPMAESDFQFEPLSYAVENLKIRFQDRLDVYVSGNIFLYYEEGEPSEVVAPDVLVIIGAEKRKRQSVKLWEEPKAPDFVLEITSKSTRSKDQGSKKGTYEFLGVTEYFCYDPTGDYLDPPLLGYRLEKGLYVPIEPKEHSASTVVLPSQTLGLDLRVTGREFRFADPRTGQALRNFAESEQQLAESETARLQAEARVRELEVQLAAMRSTGIKPNA